MAGKTDCSTGTIQYLVLVYNIEGIKITTSASKPVSREKLLICILLFVKQDSTI